MLWAPRPHRCTVTHWPPPNFCAPAAVSVSLHLSYPLRVRTFTVGIPYPKILHVKFSKFCSVFTQPLLPSYQSCCTKGLVRNFTRTAVPTPSPRSLRSLPAVEKIHPIRSGIELSSLPKSSQLCPVATLPCLGSLEISGRREVTLLSVLMSPGSTLPAPRRALGLGGRHEAARPS